MKKIVQLLTISIALVLACQPTADERLNAVREDNPPKPKIALHWDYSGESGPEHWNELSEGPDCNGQYQSPVNLVNYELKNNLPPIYFFYADSTRLQSVINNGHTIKYTFGPGDYINYDGTRYNLVQFHFHEPAEHTIDGVRYPLEIHLVHKSAGGHFAVVAILAKEGSASPAFSFLESYLPLFSGEEKEVNQAFAMHSVLPRQQQYYTYEGSLTTPPCTEGVRWLIMQKQTTVSVMQVEELEKLMPKSNYRPKQALNGRIIQASNF